MRLYRYSGAGNSFVVVDARNIDASRYKRKDIVHMLCLLHGTDGLMVLESSKVADFRMDYFNSDGSGGMLCGNGGRCIVAFADLLGVKPFHSTEYCFETADGIHRAEILSHLGECKVIRLGMKDVSDIRQIGGGWFLNTGTRHFVLFVDDAETVDVEDEGPRYRNAPAFAPEGTNVNFVSVDPDGTLRVRTFEKGVEAETLACGTGITASAIAARLRGIPAKTGEDGSLHYDIQARQDRLSVDFSVAADGSFTGIRLTGPTVFEGCLDD